MLLATSGLLTPGIARSRRLHPAFGWGAALIITMLPLRLLIAGTEAWMQFAGWLAG